MNWGLATHRRLDEARLHLQHGPIDLIIEACANEANEVEQAYAQAITRFDNVLEQLVSELALLRTPLSHRPPALRGAVAQHMLMACWPHRDVYITPMAAVAGAVADDILAALSSGRKLRRAYVNNGGDIALLLTPGEHFRVGIAQIDDGALAGDFEIDAAMPVRGIATSGWRGRSLSLGIADAVTVIASNAAMADAAATMIANAVNADHPAIERERACDVRGDSDLADLLVTVNVGALPRNVVDQALDNGARRALALQEHGLIFAAILRLQDQIRTVDPSLAPLLATPPSHPLEEIAT